jgi:hypothetical protein
MIDDASEADEALPDYCDDRTSSAMERAEIEDYITHLLVDEEKEVPKCPYGVLYILDLLTPRSLGCIPTNSRTTTLDSLRRFANCVRGARTGRA